MNLHKATFLWLTALFASSNLLSQWNNEYISYTQPKGGFTLVNEAEAAVIMLSSQDYPGVLRVAEFFREDIERVSGQKPKVITDNFRGAREVVLIGTLGKHALIDQLVADNKLDVSNIAGKWESFQIEVLENPVKGIEKALIIVGSDKRGTIYGMFDISKNMGVSPWYFWADVPAKKHPEIYINQGKHSMGSPKVKYRGIFINDEAPALAGWVEENFGGFNHKFYEKVYELILRLGGNYLWPAMWGKAIYDDDSLSAPLADEFGVVLGTSHHEPLMRAHVEWSRYGKGPWNYDQNPEVLRKFWQEGIERMGTKESLVTIGMRGDGDEAMTEGTAIELLERIIKDQREIIEEVTGKPASETPQVWALYKEVQDYYDKGMRVPDDVTLLLCDDNWGNIRVLPSPGEKDHPGGYGIYYHYDFVGGPVSYKWLNVTQIERVFEQMQLAYRYGADRIWIVNVGDIKPMEFPINFFLDYAWNPEHFQAEDLPAYYNRWAAQQFGNKFAKEIGEILALYTKYNSRRTPEMLSPDVYSLTNYCEAEIVVSDYNTLANMAKSIQDSLPKEYHDAFYQLIMFPVAACANLNEMYLHVAKNRLYATQGRLSANYHADKVEELFKKDAELTDYYHHQMANGKWNRMMSQTHIGYTSWNEPDKNYMPETVRLKEGEHTGIGIVVESYGNDQGESGEYTFPVIDPVNDQHYYFELFKREPDKIDFSVNSDDKWIRLSSNGGQLESDTRITVSIDWDKIPADTALGVVRVSGPEDEYILKVPVNKYYLQDATGYAANHGVVSIEATNYSRAVSHDSVNWLEIPNLGRTGSSITPIPITMPRQTISENSPRLEYDFFVTETGTADISVYLSPTLNFMKNEGLHYAISIDEEEPQRVNIHKGESVPDWKYPPWWNISVTENIKKKTSTHTVSAPGQHTLKLWMVDPGVVFQKIVIDQGGLEDSYLGPPESIYIKP